MPKSLHYKSLAAEKRAMAAIHAIGIAKHHTPGHYPKVFVHGKLHRTIHKK